SQLRAQRRRGLRASGGEGARRIGGLDPGVLHDPLTRARATPAQSRVLRHFAERSKRSSSGDRNARAAQTNVAVKSTTPTAPGKRRETASAPAPNVSAHAQPAAT